MSIAKAKSNPIMLFRFIVSTSLIISYHVIFFLSNLRSFKKDLLSQGKP